VKTRPAGKSAQHGVGGARRRVHRHDPPRRELPASRRKHERISAHATTDWRVIDPHRGSPQRGYRTASHVMCTAAVSAGPITLRTGRADRSSATRPRRGKRRTGPMVW
jgi:hypothetical protein